MDVPTDRRLIDVAIDLFGRNGIDGVGTRALAKAAGVQMSAITYHFGSKEGLYLACARHIVDQVTARLGPILAAATSRDTDGGDRSGARAAILAIVSGLARVMMQEDIAPLSRFVVREQMQPSAAFDIIYEGYMNRILGVIGRLMQRVAGGALAEEELAVRAIALLGQAIIFRFGRATVLRSTGWERAGEREAECVRRGVLAHTSAVLDALQAGARA